MITIRPEQYAALDADYRARFHRDILRMVKESAPEIEKTRTDEELLTTIAAAHGRANDRGLTHKPAIARYAGLAVFCGPAFDANPPIAEYLYQSPGPLPDKLRMIYEAVEQSR